MEEILALRDSLVAGDVAGALAIVEEMEEMSRDSFVETIYSYAVILLIHLIKQAAEKRTTKSWDTSIRNSIRAIHRKNKRRKAGGYYCQLDELREILDEAYLEAIDRASLEAFEGRYDADELGALVDRPALLAKALEAIAPEQ